MGKRSKVPELELKRLERQVSLLELKYQFALADGKKLEQERILAKAECLGKRIGILKATIKHKQNLEQAEVAKKINKED